MTDNEFNMLWSVILSLARTAQPIPVDQVQLLIETANRADAIMPILDPTAYRDGMDNLEDQRILANGFLAFRRAVEEVRERHAST